MHQRVGFIDRKFLESRCLAESDLASPWGHLPFAHLSYKPSFVRLCKSLGEVHISGIRSEFESQTTSLKRKQILDWTIERVILCIHTSILQGNNFKNLVLFCNEAKVFFWGRAACKTLVISRDMEICDIICRSDFISALEGLKAGKRNKRERPKKQLIWKNKNRRFRDPNTSLSWTTVVTTALDVQP